MMIRTRCLLGLLPIFAFVAYAKPRPIPVKVVVIAMFEIGEDTGDQPGELQYWVERDHLDKVYSLAAGYHAALTQKLSASEVASLQRGLRRLLDAVADVDPCNPK